jgi:predicted metalloprotease
MNSHAALLAFALAVPASTKAPTAAPAAPEPIRISVRDVDASNAKVRDAYGSLISMWTEEFRDRGARFEAPRLVRYRRPSLTSCGPVAPSNASYCPNDNTIYFDDVFVAVQGKAAGEALGTDGDMAAIGIVAHEMGHAVAMQLGYHSRRSYDNESVADCLAGAFTQWAEHQGSIEDGDIDEAFFGMAAAGDPTPQPTGNRWLDARMERQLSRQAHGTREQRMANFKSGLEGGPGACLPELRTHAE